jgi:hypothetical protein
MATSVNKGDRIEARWFGRGQAVSLAGMQMKFQASELSVRGIVKHLRGDDPVTPTTIRLYVDPDDSWSGPTVRPHGCSCSREHVEVDPAHVVRVL